MQAAMNLARWVIGLTLLTLLSCAGSPASWPRWARQLGGKLECGMTFQQVRGLAAEEGLKLRRDAPPWLGRFYVSNEESALGRLLAWRYPELWLRFDETDRLESITLAKMDGWRVMATRLSPRQNLCTGELAFQVRIEWTVRLEGAKVYVDGQRVELDAGQIGVSGGRHEVRIDKPGFEPIVRHLDLGSEDRGDQLIDLRDVELVPAQRE